MTTDNLITLLCIENGETTRFSVEVNRHKIVEELKKAIKKQKSPEFDDIAVDKLTLLRVSIPLVPANKVKPIILSEIESATKLEPENDISEYFEENPPKKTIHIIVQHPPQGNSDASLFLQRYMACP